MQPFTDADERPHPSAARVGGAASLEWWGFDWISPDASMAGFSRLLLPPTGPATWWSAMVGTDRPYLLVRDDEVDRPSWARGLETRGSLWASITCEDAFTHWSVGLESWAVEFACGDEHDAWGHERGGKDGLCLEQEWEDDGGRELTIDTGYVRWGRTYGDVLIGTGDHHETVTADGWPGVRWHAWGVPRATSRCWRATPGDPTATVVEEHGSVLPRDERGLVVTDAHLHAVHHAPLLGPGAARVSRAAAASPATGEVGWLESWFPAAS